MPWNDSRNSPPVTNGRLAQRLERSPHTREVKGSNPLSPTTSIYGHTELRIHRDVARRVVSKRWLLSPRNYCNATTPVRPYLHDKLPLTELLSEFRENPNQWSQPWPIQLRPLTQQHQTLYTIARFAS